MDTNKLSQSATLKFSIFGDLAKLALALFFVAGVWWYVSMNVPANANNISLLLSAAVIGAYMAINIGANDVANNVGPAVGSKALSLTGAIIIAAVFEAGGALIAGGDVVGTIKNGIIDPAFIKDADTFIWLMMAALLAAAIWLNVATALNAPVSTTHSIVGGVLGAGIAAGGMGIADWGVVGEIALSWLVSPIMGGLISAAFLYIIKRTITYQADMVVAAQKIVPILVAVMAWSFSTYILMKGLKHIWKVELLMAMGIALLIAIGLYFAVKPWVNSAALKIDNSKESINGLFALPLIFSAALLSFAHGANDVANAVGPLAAINDAVLHGGVVKKAAIPLWVLMLGALGIVVGLGLYGPKLIRTVGSEITDLDKMRAYCVAMAAAITVIVASQLGLPVSSTHIAVGAVFGVGFLREYLKHNNAKRIEAIILHHEGNSPEQLTAVLQAFEAASIANKKQMLRDLKTANDEQLINKKERKSLKKGVRQELVKRSHIYKIAAAWVITVPMSAVLAALFFFAIRGFMLP